MRKRHNKHAKRTKDNVNRNHKDTVFVDLFAMDKDAKKNLVSLVNALYGCNLNENEVTYEVTRIDNVMYKTMQNDIGVLIDDKFLVLGEHQSTINENMPLRCLLYVSRIYEQRISPKDRYTSKLIKIPYPQFFVFYNGRKDEKNKIMRLSDAFYEPIVDLMGKIIKRKSLELTLNFININYSSNKDLLKKCKVLGEYAMMVSKSREILDSQGEKNPEKAMRDTIKWCIENDVLAEYLSRKGREVCNMLVGEYNEELRKAKEKEEREEAVQEAVEKAVEKVTHELEEKHEKEMLQMKEEAEQEKYLTELRMLVTILKSGIVSLDLISQSLQCTKPYLEDICSLIEAEPDIAEQEIYDKVIRDKVKSDDMVGDTDTLDLEESDDIKDIE